MNDKTKRKASIKRTRRTPMTSVRCCSTHHHACACREERLYAALSGVARDLANSADETAFQAYIDINELWVELYGHEIVEL